MATQQGVIKKFMKSLDTTSKKGEAAIDAAIKACSTFGSVQEAINKMVSDCRNAKSADDFLKTYCGIDLDNDDTGAITGWDAGGSSVKTAKSIIPEEGSLIEFTSGDWFEVNGLTVKLGQINSSGNTVIRNFDELSKQEIYLWRAIYTWWIKNDLNLIAESYGDNFSFLKSKSSTDNTKPTTKTMYVIFEDVNNNELAAVWGGPAYAQKSTNNLDLHINLNWYKSATGKNGESTNEEAYLDRTLAHELTHAVMRANIDYFDYLSAFVKEGVAELTHGIDDISYRAEDIRTLANYSSKLNQALTMETTASNVEIAGVSNPSYAGGYMFLRYLARQAGDLTIENFDDNQTLRTFNGKDSIQNDGSNVMIYSGSGNDTIYNDTKNGDGGSYVTIDAGAGNDFVRTYDEGSKVSINGGTGKDTLSNGSASYNGGKDVTLVGGKGNDSLLNYNGENTVFKYTSGDGNDKVIGFNDSSSLQIGNGNGTYSAKTSGKNIIVTVGSGKISLMGAASLSSVYINGVDIKGTTSTTTLTLTDSNKSPVTVGSAVKNVDASARTKAVKITGNNLDNTIIGGAGKDTLYGGNGDDSIWGQTGNDKLYGNNGDDILVGNEGKDTIYGGNGDDSIWGSTGNDKLYGGNGDDWLIGGTGNDSLWGDTGADTFYYSYGGGKDIIFGFDSKDTLTLDNLDFTTSYNQSKGTITFKVDGGSVTLKEFTATTFHINDDIYKISNGKFKKK